MRLSILFIMFSGVVNSLLISNIKPLTTTFDFVGDTAPLGFFDPMKIASNLEEPDIKYLREAELQHSRIAMVSAIILPFLDLQNNELSINVMSLQKASSQISWLVYFSFFEMSRILGGYENFFQGGKMFKLKTEYQPGNLIGIQDISTELQEKELNNGRLAMLGTLGYITQELVTNHKIL